MSIPLTLQQAAEDPRARMARKISERKEQTRNSDLRNRCGTCTHAYRDAAGNVQCGMAQLGEGHIITKPFDEGCTKMWNPRREFQPFIGNKQFNEEFARYRRLLEMKQKGINPNPLIQSGFQPRAIA